MRICVLGAGAIGGYIGTRLAASGAETSAVARGATLDALRAHGWRVDDAEGVRTTAPVRATDDAASLGPQDLVVLAVKAQSLGAALPSLTPLVGPGTTVLTAMNGVPWWFFQGGFGGPCAGRTLESVDPGGRIAAAVPAERVLGCVVHMSSSAPEPGLVHHFRGTGLIVGEPDNTESARVREVAGLLRAAGLDATVSTEIQKDIWYKLWGNLTINPVAALTGATGDRILADGLVREFCHSAMAEAQEIGARIGCPIAESPADRSEVTRKLGAFTPSMLQDARAGRPLELDALVGAVREIGAAVGVATPQVDTLLGLTRLAAATRP
ncbi:2-dehydropantoate 2-reductase [Streptomyces sp. NPDC050504]|uniref:2-dehydropantoate 2-reductase n=1 Tax=Streptomyces sp. NPDC050504 TaxID=3365618 RepID=UPI0037AFFE0E